MHKNWSQLALKTKEIFPDATCFITTNGILLHTISDEKLIYYCKEKDFRFGVSLYPLLNLLPLYDSIKERFDRLNLTNYLNWNFSRIIFGKACYQNKINDNYENCYKNIANACNQLFIYKNNIYTC